MADRVAVLAGKFRPLREGVRIGQAIAAKGRMCRTIQTGCVHNWKRLISVMPWVTSGMMTTALMR